MPMYTKILIEKNKVRGRYYTKLPVMLVYHGRGITSLIDIICYYYSYLKDKEAS